MNTRVVMGIDFIGNYETPNEKYVDMSPCYQILGNACSTT